MSDLRIALLHHDKVTANWPTVRRLCTQANAFHAAVDAAALQTPQRRNESD